MSKKQPSLRWSIRKEALEDHHHRESGRWLGSWRKKVLLSPGFRSELPDGQFGQSLPGWSVSDTFRSDGKIMMENPITPDEGILHHPEGVDLVPSNIELSGMEVALVNAMSRETILRQYLDTVKQNYDCSSWLYAVFKVCWSRQCVGSCRQCVIPVQAAYLPAKGLEQLLGTINKVKRQISLKLRIEGILLTMVDSRTNYSKDISNLIRESYGGKLKVYKTDIPRSVRAEEISAEGNQYLQAWSQRQSCRSL